MFGIPTGGEWCRAGRCCRADQSLRLQRAPVGSLTLSSVCAVDTNDRARPSAMLADVAVGRRPCSWDVLSVVDVVK